MVPFGDPGAGRRRRPLPRHHARRIPLALLLAVLLACTSTNIFEPPFDCSDAVGAHFIALAGEGSAGFTEPRLAVGDSMQFDAQVRRVTESSPIFNLLAGWSCQTGASVVVAATITFTSGDTDVLAPRPNGWFRGIAAGFALVTATSTLPSATRVIGVLVTSSVREP